MQSLQQFFRGKKPIHTTFIRQFFTRPRAQLTVRFELSQQQPCSSKQQHSTFPTPVPHTTNLKTKQHTLTSQQLFRPTLPQYSRGYQSGYRGKNTKGNNNPNPTPQQQHVQKHKANQEGVIPPSPPQSKSRSGIKYHIPEHPEHVTQQQQSKPLIHNSPAAARAHHDAEKAKNSKNAGRDQAESLITLFNKIRQHKIYQLTRVFLAGSVFILMSKRVSEAKMTPEEVFAVDDTLLDQVKKVLRKTFRVLLATLTRTWTPFGVADEETGIDPFIYDEVDEYDEDYIFEPIGDPEIETSKDEGESTVVPSGVDPNEPKTINVWDEPLQAPAVAREVKYVKRLNLIEKKTIGEEGKTQTGVEQEPTSLPHTEMFISAKDLIGGGSTQKE